MEEMRMVGLGETVQVDPGHRGLSPDAMDKAIAYAEKSKTHLWVMFLVHRISLDALAKMRTTLRCSTPKACCRPTSGASSASNPTSRRCGSGPAPATRLPDAG
jgi:hypothetical protein